MFDVFNTTSSKIRTFSIWVSDLQPLRTHRLRDTFIIKELAQKKNLGQLKTRTPSSFKSLSRILILTPSCNPLDALINLFFPRNPYTWQFQSFLSTTLGRTNKSNLVLTFNPFTQDWDTKLRQAN